MNADLAKIAAASFVAFDDRFFDVIGPNPSLEKLFTLPEQTHEAPNYLPKENKVIVSGFNDTYDYYIHLDTEPLTIEKFSANPPLQGVNGGILHSDTLILGTDGFLNSTPPGLYTLDPASENSSVLLNNYREIRFNTIDDLTIDHLGQVWFVDAPCVHPASRSTFH